MIGQPTAITALFAPEGAVDRITALMEVRGEGATIPAAGEHHIPKYAGTDLDCIEACQNNTTLPGGCAPCEYAALRVQALPTEDSYFYQWNSVGLPAPLESETADIPMIGSSTNVIATFLDRPGLKGLDLLGDLGEFLTDVGEIADAGNLYDLDVDYGGVSFEGGVKYYDGNGVPDAAEFALLESVMKDIRLNLTHTGGIGSEHPWKSFHRNQVRARADLPTASDETVNVIAGYMTLGSNGHVGQAKVWAMAEYGVQLNAQNFDRLGGERLLPEKDADADGVTNGAEWEQTTVVGTPGPAARK